MKKNRWVVSGLAVTMSLLFSGGIAIAKAQESTPEQMQMSRQLKVGKTGEIHFTQPHKIGDVVLPSGTYRLVHRTEGEKHFIRFKQIDGRLVTGEIECRIEPLPEKVAHTSVTVMPEAGTLRIVRIEIAGENVAHLF